MEKPFIVCHMMTSIDGRIDCTMTGKLNGVEDYSNTLKALETPTTVSGRVTAELEIALPGKFEVKNFKAKGEEAFSKKIAKNGYEVIVDTHGVLLWPDASEMEKPYLIITSEQVSTEYLAYLDSKNISWIVCGEERINLKRAVEILSEEFHVQRMAVVGGPAINTAFLEADLLDEISLLIGAGIDGRVGFPTVFDGLPVEHKVIDLELKDVIKYESGAVLLSYQV
ncbi:hypothetical protein IGI39_004592 [Enterococcus sp. AZ135]|uniref:RibD family protein n=1 Tax=unclassified Enterococcus TaxID=2608891 RepID=UPI003F26FC7C